MTRYYCHICDSYVHVDPATLRCVTCGEDFIEATDDEVPQNHPDPPQAAPEPGHMPGYQQFNLGPNPGLDQLLTNLSQALGNVGGNGAFQNWAAPAQGVPGAGPFFPQPMNPMMGNMNNGAPGAQRNFNAQNGPFEFQQQNAFPFGNFLNFMAPAGSLQDLFQGLFTPQQMGDYVSDAGMAGLLDRLFRQHQTSQHPAGKDVVDNLPTVTFTKETATGECAICKCDWEENDTAVDLPCHHLFHKDCIKKWFETSNLCPMCRHELPTDDPEYEKIRKEKEAEILRQSTGAGATPSSSSSTSQTETSVPASQGSSSPQTSGPNSGLSPAQQALLNELIEISSDDEDLFSADSYLDSEESDGFEDSAYMQPSNNGANNKTNPSDYNFDVD